MGSQKNSEQSGGTKGSAISESLLQQNEFTNQLMLKIWKELKAKGSKQKQLKKHSDKFRKRNAERAKPRHPHHGKGCKCPKCRKWLSYVKGKSIEGKTSRFYMPQLDGNGSDSHLEQEHPGSSLARAPNEMALHERASTSGQSQQPSKKIPASREACNPGLLEYSPPTRQTHQDFAGHHSYPGISNGSKRPAKLAAKKLMKKMHDFIYQNNLSESENGSSSSSNYNEESAESTEDETDDDEDYDNEDFFSSHSALQNSKTKPKKAESTCSNLSKSKPRRDTHYNSPDSDDNGDPPRISSNLPSDLNEDEICHVESFDLDLNSTRVDQINIPATAQQAPEQYIRFLSKFNFIASWFHNF